MTFVIATRGIDLSIGSVANLSLCFAAFLAGTRIEAAAHDRGRRRWPIRWRSSTGAGARPAQRAADRSGRAQPADRDARHADALSRVSALHLTGAALTAVQRADPVVRARPDRRASACRSWSPPWSRSAAAVALARTVPGRQLLALGGSPRSAVETGIPIQRAAASGLWSGRLLRRRRRPDRGRPGRRDQFRPGLRLRVHGDHRGGPGRHQPVRRPGGASSAA